MVRTANLGFPRFGANRALKRALEAYWSGNLTADEFNATACDLRATHWQRQQAAGIDTIPSNDFSLYDHVLDTVALVGAVPARYGWTSDRVDLDTYFAMARGSSSDDVAAMEMTKWFDTNYHYLVPEFAPKQQFRLGSTKPIDHFREAQALGIHTRPVLLGPVSFLLLGKPDHDPLDLLDALLPIYADVLAQLHAAGATWVQIDEPCLVLDLTPPAHAAYQRAYDALRDAASDLRLMLTTYFGALGDNLALAFELPVAGLHLDLVRAPDQLGAALELAPADLTLSLGVVDGRNIWRTDLDGAIATILQVAAVRPAHQIIVAPSCSLLHVPLDLEAEPHLDAEVRFWLAFASQKLDELALITRAVNDGRGYVANALDAARATHATRRSSAQVHRPDVAARLHATTPAMTERTSRYTTRHKRQQERFGLPLLPTTTIGSFPQTPDIRKHRAAAKAGRITEAEYDAFLRAEIERTVRIQEEIGLDVLVHGESERTDMVEYFGEQLTGILFTEHGWVQSYGSRGVRPPIIFGDVARPQPMTVAWSAYAQSLTHKPMKGMLTGPITILQWSFVRDDVSRETVCRQIALALRDEVQDLEAVGIEIIQLDEPALREGLPLRRADWQFYLDWAVACFKLAASGVADTTQIHTHMCYAEFNDIMEAIAALDADVISIESSRSKSELLDAIVAYKYPNEIGPGVYDIHSPHVPHCDEMVRLLRNSLMALTPAQLWVNPDCGLKTRRWEEVTPALTAMVEAAQRVRAEISDGHSTNEPRTSAF